MEKVTFPKIYFFYVLQKHNNVSLVFIMDVGLSFLNQLLMFVYVELQSIP